MYNTNFANGVGLALVKQSCGGAAVTTFSIPFPVFAMPAGLIVFGVVKTAKNDAPLSCACYRLVFQYLRWLSGPAVRCAPQGTKHECVGLLPFRKLIFLFCPLLCTPELKSGSPLDALSILGSQGKGYVLRIWWLSCSNKFLFIGHDMFVPRPLWLGVHQL